MSKSTICEDYYDNNTQKMLLDLINDDDRTYIKTNNEDITTFLCKRWRTIVNSLPNNYYNQYKSKTTPQDRNDWFKKYLDYPTKDISKMPDLLYTDEDLNQHTKCAF